jgi:hypothetical protein
MFYLATGRSVRETNTIDGLTEITTHFSQAEVLAQPKILNIIQKHRDLLYSAFNLQSAM